MWIDWKRTLLLVLAWLGVLFLVQLAHLEHVHGAEPNWTVEPTQEPMPRCAWGIWYRGQEGPVFGRHRYGRYLEHPVCAQDEGLPDAPERMEEPDHE